MVVYWAVGGDHLDITWPYVCAYTHTRTHTHTHTHRGQRRMKRKRRSMRVCSWIPWCSAEKTSMLVSGWNYM